MNEGSADWALSPSRHIETGKEPGVAEIATRVAGETHGHTCCPRRGDELSHRGTDQKFHRRVLDKSKSTKLCPQRVGMESRSRVHGARFDADKTAAAGKAEEQHEVGIVFCE